MVKLSFLMDFLWRFGQALCMLMPIAAIHIFRSRNSSHAKRQSKDYEKYIVLKEDLPYWEEEKHCGAVDRKTGLWAYPISGVITQYQIVRIIEHRKNDEAQRKVSFRNGWIAYNGPPSYIVPSSDAEQKHDNVIHNIMRKTKSLVHIHGNQSLDSLPLTPNLEPYNDTKILDPTVVMKQAVYKVVRLSAHVCLSLHPLPRHAAVSDYESALPRRR